MPEKETTKKRNLHHKKPHKNNSFISEELNTQAEDDYIFPVFSNSVEVEKETNDKDENKIKKINKKTVYTSPYVLDLKNKKAHQGVNPEFTYLNQNQPLTKISNNYNPDNWFGNLESPNYEDLIDEKIHYLRQINFESPEDAQKTNQKQALSQPEKYKRKNHIKLNFGQGIITSSKAGHDNKKIIRIPKILKIISHFFSTIWFFITAPFLALDFLVDRSLKILWWLSKNFILGIINLFLLFFTNLKKLFILGLPHRLTLKQPANSGYSYSKKRNLKKIFKPLFSFALICLIIILPLQLITFKQKTNLIKGQVLGESLAGLEALKKASSFSQDFNFTNAGQEFEKAYINFSLAKTYLDNLDTFSQEIIKLAPQGKIAENLLIIGQLAAQVGQDFTNLVDNFSNLNGQNNLMTKISLAQNTLQKIEPNFLELSQRIKNLDQDTLKKYLDEKTLQKISLFQGALPALEENFNKTKTLINFLTEFFGNERPKNYLFVFQNNNELRATGGFMGSFALVELNKGIITKLEVPGGGFYDLKAGNKTLVEAPKPFQLFSPNWTIWNANWFPDWPASAKKISWFYEKTINGLTTDGVIALTPNVLADLLKITGPIEMTDYKKTISANNLIEELQEAVELEYDKDENKPKKIIADLLPKILEKIFQTDAKQSLPLLSALFKNANEKNILVWFNDQSMQNVISNFGWDGSIKNYPYDFLMVVHTNAGGGKTDLVIKNKIEHQVSLNSEGKLIATVNLTRKHEGNPENFFEKEMNVDYVRFYVPENAKLISATGFDVMPANLFKTVDDPDTIKDPDLLALEKNPTLDEISNIRITNEFNKTVFANWLIVKPGEEKTVTLSYELPFKLSTPPQQSWWQKILNFLTGKNKESQKVNYGLIIQKQAGVQQTNFSSQIEVPANLKLIKNSGKNTVTNNNNTYYYVDNLETDGYYQLELSQ